MNYDIYNFKNEHTYSQLLFNDIMDYDKIHHNSKLYNKPLNNFIIYMFIINYLLILI